jgi:hypothetical protein
MKTVSAKNAVPPAVAPQTEVSQLTRNLIDQIKGLWGTTQTAYMKMGEHFTQLRAETKAYQKNHKTGISYAEAVRQTGVPRSTAEFYRSLYETCVDFSIPPNVFLALQDNGVNLASDRYQDHDKRELRKADVKALRDLDVAEHGAVKKMAEGLKKAHPVDKAESVSLMQQVQNLQDEISARAVKIAGTKDKDYKAFLEGEQGKDEAELLRVQLKVIAQLVSVFGIVDITDPFTEQPDLRLNLWEGVVNAGTGIRDAFAKAGKKRRTAGGE